MKKNALQNKAQIPTCRFLLSYAWFAKGQFGYGNTEAAAKAAPGIISDVRSWEAEIKAALEKDKGAEMQSVVILNIMPLAHISQGGSK
jgi:hypothetical protein